MSIGKHIKEHAMLGISGDGSRNLTVGVDGQFSTIQAAIDYIVANNDCFIALETHTDYVLAFGDTYAGFSVSGWAQDSNAIALRMGTLDLAFSNVSNEYWLGVNSESRLYKLLMAPAQPLAADSFHVFTDGKRIEASIVAADLAFTLYRENPYTIVLMDTYYKEVVTIDANISVRFVSAGKSSWYTTASNSSIKRGANFKYGAIEFGVGVSLVNAGVGAFLSNYSGDGWDNATVGNKNTIELRFVDGAKIVALGSDMFSPNIAIGGVLINNGVMDNEAVGGTNHFLFFIARGAISVTDSKWKLTAGNIGVSMAEALLADACTARNFIIEGLNIEIHDPNDKFSNVAVIAGSRYADEVHIGTISINGTTNNIPVTLVDSHSVANGITPVVSNVYINAANINVHPGSHEIWKGLAGQAANVFITNCAGGIINKGDSDVITCLAHDTPQAVAYAAAITPDANAGNRVDVGALTGNITVNAPSNPQQGQVLEIAFTQDATGSRAITWNAVFKAQTLTAGGANTKAIYSFRYDGTHWVQLNTAQWL